MRRTAPPRASRPGAAGGPSPGIDADATVVGSRDTGGSAPPPPAADDEPRELPRDTRVGRYLLLGRIGAGAMGVVYSAYDPELDRKVALKLVLPGDGDAASASGLRLLREAQALARLTHPNVVAVHDVGQHEGKVWIAMEFVAGQTLGAWVSARPRGWPEVLQALTDAARGVAAAHAAGLIHRDLKPENVMIGDDDRVRVMDFGLAHGRTQTATESELVTTATPELALGATIASTNRVQPEHAVLAMHVTRSGGLLGTPAYMAPEQWRGAAAGPAADQFAWCVMAWELLFAERPFTGATMSALRTAVLTGKRLPPPRRSRVPGWLRRILERGLASEPEKRWPTMAALLTALQRGRTRRRAQTAAGLLTGAALIAGAIAGERQWEHARRVRACADAGAEIHAVWNDSRARRVRDDFTATGSSQAATTVDKLIPRLDAWAAAWSRLRTRVCSEAEVEGTRSPELSALATACLAERRDELDALLAAFTAADATTVMSAVQAAAGMPAPATCADRVALERRPAVPGDPEVALRVAALRRDLARAQALEWAGHFDLGLERAEALVTRAKLVGHAPLTVDAGALLGSLATRAGKLERAERTLRWVYIEAGAIGADETAATAATELMFVVGVMAGRSAEGLLWATAAEMLLRRLGEQTALRGATYVSTLAGIDQARGDLDGALAGHRQALALRRELLGDDHPDVATSFNNLANTHAMRGERDEAIALQRQALAIRERALGPDHPDVAMSLGNLANVYDERGEHDQALALQTRALDIRERALGPDHPHLAHSLNNLAIIHRIRGELDAAQALQRRALAIRRRSLGRDHPDVGQSLMNLANVTRELRQYEEAQALSEESLRIFEAARGPDHRDVAHALDNLAETLAARGASAAAATHYARALAIWERTLGPAHPDLAFALVGLGRLALADGRAHDAVALLERAVQLRDRADEQPAALAEARFALARALQSAARPGDPSLARARELAQQAADAYRGAGPRERDALATVEAWIRDRDQAAASAGR